MVIIFQEVKSEATPDHGEGLQPIEEKVGRKKNLWRIALKLQLKTRTNLSGKQ